MRSWLPRAAGALCAIALLANAPSACAELAPTLRIYAAGSLRAAFEALVKASGLPPGAAILTTGASGLLRQRLEQGEQADLFASADLGQPRRLQAAGRSGPVVLFARNRLCAIGRQSLHLDQANLLARLLDPAVKLAISTPGADPSGDYAWAVFKRAEALRPGAQAALKAKAIPFGGGAAPKSGTLRETLFLSGQADIVLGYCSGAPALLGAVPGLTSVPLPPDIAVTAEYGLTILTPDPEAARFALFTLSEAGQAILARSGLLPVGLPADPDPAAK